MNPMWICAFHLLIFYGFSSKLLEPQFKLDDLRNHFCNSVVHFWKAGPGEIRTMENLVSAVVHPLYNTEFKILSGFVSLEFMNFM